MFKSNRFKYFSAALISVAIWGFFSIPLRNLKSFPSADILYYRIFASLVITWLVILIFRRKHLAEDFTYLKSETRANQLRILKLTLLAGVLITGNWFSFIYAVNEVSLTSAAFAYMVCPLITALGGFFILKEELSTIKLIAIGIAVISILLLAKGSLTDVLWSVFIASLYAFYLIIQRVITRIDKFNMLGVQLLISVILMLPLFLYQHHSLITDVYFWINILVIAVVFTIIPLFLSLYALIGLPSSTLGIIIYINPIVAFAVAFFYFDESINTFQVYAYTLLLAAVIIFNWNILSSLFVKNYNKLKTSSQ
ncbi:EamA family transporter [Daejeonella oryzae]|uniref:EamA family transporter n=1 Tax=Daejeonella oryzae TaxID=1122943 RepID=UPI00040C41D8|nr:EamA family transporter [Daejeonella oryzae]